MSTSDGGYGDPATRRRILDSAWALIEEGDTEVRLSDVASRAGVSRRAIYLHFGDRAGLLTALVAHMDEVLDVSALAEPVWRATSGEDLLAAVVAFYAELNPRVDPVARLLEARPEDAAAMRAWRDRMELRRQTHRGLLQRLSDREELGPGWTVDTAADVLHAAMLPAVWRELAQIGWSAEQCRAGLATLLGRALLNR